LKNILIPVIIQTTSDWVYPDYYKDVTHAIIYGVFSKKYFTEEKNIWENI